MKGVVFNLLESVVVQEHGEDAWDDLLAAAGVDGVYTSLGSYGDGELFTLVAAASAALGSSPQEIVRWFGRQAMPLFIESHPEFFAPHRTTRPFVLELNDIIHPEVRKLYPGADVPKFDFDVSSDEVLVIGYCSPRRLCGFAEGLIEGAADHFGEVVGITQPMCMLKDDPKCVLELRFAPASP